MECGGFYKIGWSKRPQIRLAYLQASNPFPVTLAGVIEGSPEHEAEWHLAFRDKRVVPWPAGRGLSHARLQATSPICPRLGRRVGVPRGVQPLLALAAHAPFLK